MPHGYATESQLASLATALARLEATVDAPPVVSSATERVTRPRPAPDDADDRDGLR